MATVSKEYTFEAAHQLVNHSGKCRNLHGHSYKVVVYVSDFILREDQGSSGGMVIDYGDIDDIMKPLLEQRLDHKYLNESLPEIPVHTAELIACWIFGAITDRSGIKSEHLTVEVHETAKVIAVVDEQDWAAANKPKPWAGFVPDPFLAETREEMSDVSGDFYTVYTPRRNAVPSIEEFYNVRDPDNISY